MKFEKLGNILSIQKGRKNTIVETVDSNSNRVLQIDDLRNDKLIQYTNDITGVFVTEEDLMIAWDGANAGTVGYGKRGYIGSTIAALRKKHQGYNTLFLGKFLQTQFSYLQKNATGATIPHIDRKSLENLKIPILKIEDQIKIATILGNVEALIKQRKESIDLLDVYLKSVFLEMFGDLVTNEKGWKRIQLHGISEIQGGLQVTHKREINNIELPYLRVANVYRNSLDLSVIKTIKVTNQEAQRTRLEKHDILVVEGHGNPNEIGRSAIWSGLIENCLHQNHLIRVRVDSTKANSNYINYFINSASGKQQMFKASKTTSGLNTISTKIVKETIINLPNLKLQTQFEKILQKNSILKTQYEKSLQELENLFSSLSQKAFKGELDLSKINRSNFMH